MKFKSRLLAIVVCVFAWVGANAYYYTNNNTVLVIEPSDFNNNFNNADASAMLRNGTVNTIKLVGNFTSGWSGTWVVNGGSTGKESVTTIDLSGAVMTGTANWSFKDFIGLRTIKWPVEGNITNIPHEAFNECGIETVHIPGYITSIQQHAFNEASSSHYLKTVIFDEYDADGDGESDVNIGLITQAFSNCYALSDVYIETTGYISAAQNAFPHFDTYGHSDPTRDFATLHFPASKADAYVNPNHTLDEATANDDGAFQAWLAAHYDKAGQAQNGFYEFVANGPLPPDNAPDMGDVVLKTFSDAKIDYVVPNGVKAYIVNKISKDGDKYKAVLKKVNVIPHGTGVILYGGTNAKTSGNQPKKFLSMTAVKYTGPAYTYKEDNTDPWRNLLVGTATEDGSGTNLKPYELNNTQTAVEWRIFCLGKFSGTKEYKKHTGIANYVGFFRSLPGTMKSGMAFLRVPTAEFGEATGGEIIVPAKEWDDYSKEYIPGESSYCNDAQLRAKGWWYTGTSPNLTPITWTVDWGERSPQLASFAKFSGEPIFEELDNGIATLIVPSSMVETVDTEEYYTLQGVKVNNPSKGVYIKKGKKVIIK